MLEVVGQPSLEALVDTALPSGIRVPRTRCTSTPPHLSQQCIAELRALANRNTGA